jgi:hypothetical protein
VVYRFRAEQAVTNSLDELEADMVGEGRTIELIWRNRVHFKMHHSESSPKVLRRRDGSVGPEGEGETPIDTRKWAGHLRKAKFWFGILLLILGVAFLILAINALSISNSDYRVEFVVGEVSLSVAVLLAGVTVIADSALDSYMDEQMRGFKTDLKNIDGKLDANIAAQQANSKELEKTLRDELWKIQTQVGFSTMSNEMLRRLNDLETRLDKVEPKITEKSPEPSNPSKPT